MMANYYELLEISPDSDPGQIRVAYRKQAMRWHPDKNPGDKQAEERFKRITEAYSVLSDPGSRMKYDQSLRENQADAAFHGQRMDPADAAEIFFQEMIGLAYELTMQNVRWSEIAAALRQRGCPEAIANTIARGVEIQRKAAIRKSAGRAFLWALGSIILGLIITAISYSTSASGGTYIVTIGLFLYGGANVCRALYFLVSGRAPLQTVQPPPEVSRKQWEAQMSGMPKNYCAACNKMYANATICPVHGTPLTNIV